MSEQFVAPKVVRIHGQVEVGTAAKLQAAVAEEKLPKVTVELRDKHGTRFFRSGARLVEVTASKSDGTLLALEIDVTAVVDHEDVEIKRSKKATSTLRELAKLERGIPGPQPRDRPRYWKQEIRNLLAGGMHRKEVALQLGISVATVRMVE